MLKKIKKGFYSLICMGMILLNANFIAPVHAATSDFAVQYTDASEILTDARFIRTWKASVTGTGTYTGKLSFGTKPYKDILGSSASFTFTTQSYTNFSWSSYERTDESIKGVLNVVNATSDQIEDFLNIALCMSYGYIAQADALANLKLEYLEFGERNSTITVSIPEQTFNPGKNVEPGATVVVGSNTLVAGTDYDIVYSDNNKVGTAKATINFKGAYAGTASKTQEFEIKAKTLTDKDVVIAPIPSQIYTGKAITPTTSIKVGGNTLVAGTDYDIVYSDNNKVGTATATINFTGNYTGTQKTTFAIAYSDSISNFVRNMMNDDGSYITDINASNYKNIVDSIEDYNKLSSEDKAILDKALKDAGISKTYADINREALAEAFLQQFATGVEDGEGFYNLPQDLKDEINKRLAARNDGVTFEELLKRVNELLDKTISFIETYVTDGNDGIYKEVNSKNYAKILSGKDAWDKLSQDEKDAINLALVTNGGKSYDDLLKLALAEQKKATVATGDTLSVLPYATMMLMSAAGLIAIKKRRNYSID